jgi:BTB/POZ domain
MVQRIPLPNRWLNRRNPNRTFSRLIKSVAISTNNMTEKEGDQQVVTFDVGGTIYRVLRTLLDMHPESMLARMASETWNTDNAKALFIERSGARFEFVLDYLRDGSVSVPLSVSKDAVMADLAYYNIQFEQHQIQGPGSFFALVDKERADSANDRTKAKKLVEGAEEKELAIRLAGCYLFHGSFEFNKSTGKSQYVNVGGDSSVCHNIFYSSQRVIFLRERLHHFGLTFEERAGCITVRALSDRS